MYANSVPRRRSRSKTYTGTMLPDDSDSPDESGDFENLTSSTDTLRGTSAGSPGDHARDLTSSSINRIQGQTRSNAPSTLATSETRVYRITEFKEVTAVGHRGRTPLRACLACHNFQYFHQFEKKWKMCRQCLHKRRKHSRRRKPSRPFQPMDDDIYLGFSFAFLFDVNGQSLKYCDSCKLVQPMTRFSKEEKVCDDCIAQQNQLRYEMEAEAAKFDKRYYHFGRQFVEPQTLRDTKNARCDECREEVRSRNATTKTVHPEERLCGRRSQFKEVGDFSFRNNRPCTLCWYGGPPPSIAVCHQLLNAKGTLDALCHESQLHLSDNYLAKEPPKHIESICLEMSALDGVPVDLIGGAWPTLSLTRGSTVAFLIHGRDGLSVSEAEWVRYEQRYGHLQTTIIIFEARKRMASEVQTGWVEATPGRLMCMFDTKRIVENIRGNESDIVYRRLLGKWSAQYERRMLLRAAGAVEGGIESQRNSTSMFKKGRFGKYNPMSNGYWRKVIRAS